MKLRIRDNSLRLRLTQGEVEMISTDGIVSASIQFSESVRLQYRLVPDADVAEACARYDDNRIDVLLPRALSRAWANSNEVGIRVSQTLGAGAELTLLVEKDFACLQERDGEDESDMYPHPEEGDAIRC